MAISLFSPETSIAQNYKFDWSKPQWFFYLPSSVTVDSSDNVYVTQPTRNLIHKFDSSGNFIAKWSIYGTGNGESNYPIYMAFFDQVIYTLNKNHLRVLRHIWLHAVF